MCVCQHFILHIITFDLHSNPEREVLLPRSINEETEAQGDETTCLGPQLSKQSNQDLKPRTMIPKLEPFTTSPSSLYSIL